MCGIAGLWDGRGSRVNGSLEQTTWKMADAVAHRGPEGRGVWVDEAAGLGLGHRRLSIIDLSDAASQPMHSTSGRYVITYNGEIFNYREIARELEARGARLNSNSDTAVLLAAVEAWGLPSALERSNGMFAFALWDRETRQLSLVRDRLGIKPLYVYQADGTLLFGSELKALVAHPGFRAQIEPSAVEAFLRYRYVPAPRTIYRNTLKLRPGHMLTISRPDSALPDSVPYWSAIEAACGRSEDRFEGGDREAEDALDTLLNDAVGQHMVSDVPVGAFLSGGIDSSTVVALMRSHTRRPVKTFSIGFSEAQYDEAKDAAAVASHLGTDHTQMHVTDSDVRNVVPALPQMFDEPFADPSQVPTYLVSALARQKVAVSLSGDGGDELFGGYTRYQWIPRTWHRLGRLPPLVRRVSLGALHVLSPEAINRVLDPLQALLPRRFRLRHLGEKVHKLAANVHVCSSDDLYRAVASAHQQPERLLEAASRNGDHLIETLSALPPLDPASRMMLADLLTYLPDDILTKVDRCSMAVALESRVPLLDYRVVEFAWRLPTHMKIRDGSGKWLLRRVLSRYVPPALFERPKTGFDLPISQWLRGPLRDWAGDLLSPASLRNSELLDAVQVRRVFEEHQSGRRNHRDILWALLIFETWRKRWQPTTA